MGLCIIKSGQIGLRDTEKHKTSASVECAGLCRLPFSLAPRQSTCCWITHLPFLRSAWPLSQTKQQKKIFYGHFAISPSCFVFVSHTLPFLWQMELSKEVKDDAVQLCGSGVMRPGASTAWQQEPRDTAGPLIRSRRTEQKLPASSSPSRTEKTSLWSRFAVKQVDPQTLVLCSVSFSDAV